jgi:hypothetical protein
MENAVRTGKIQRGELKLSKIGKALEDFIGLRRIPGPKGPGGNQSVDISVIKIGGPFDKGPYIPVP